MSRYWNARDWQGFLAALALVSAALPAFAQENPIPQLWEAVDASTGQLTSITDLQALKYVFPDSASVRRRLINAYLEAEREADALAEAVELVERGYAFSAAGQELLLTLGPSDKQRDMLALQARNGSAIEIGDRLAVVPAEVRLVEGVWRDPRSGDLFATSVVSRALYVRRGEREWTPLPLDGAGSLSGMAFDPASALLWVASGVFDETPEPETAFRGAIAIDPATGVEKRRFPAPEGASPGDLAVTANGTILASDPLSGAIYAGLPKDDALRVLIPPGTFRSPQGLVPWHDKGLLVSDYAYGLALIDPDVIPWRVTTDEPMLLDGIDGMWLHGDKIIAVQNGARPPRIVELTMSPDGRKVTSLRELERAHPAWTEPVGGAVAGDDLIYVATGQWDSFGKGGELRDGAAPQATELRTLPLVEGPAPPP
jgi:hypothetical protein